MPGGAGADRLVGGGGRGATPGRDVGRYLAEALTDNTRTPVPEQASFREDYPRWRAGFRTRTRAVLDALAVGERTGDVARRFGISQGRVSQLRRTFAASWRRFHEG